MRKSLKVARGLQLLGCAFLIFGIASCSTSGDPQTMARSFMVGGMLVIGARIYEWLSKE